MSNYADDDESFSIISDDIMDYLDQTDSSYSFISDEAAPIDTDAESFTFDSDIDNMSIPSSEPDDSFSIISDGIEDVIDRDYTTNKRHHDDIDSESDDDSNEIVRAIDDAGRLQNIFGEGGSRHIPGFEKRKRVKRSVPAADAQVGGHCATDRHAPVFRITNRVDCRAREGRRIRATDNVSLITIQHNLSRGDIILDIDSEVSALFERIMEPFLSNCEPHDFITVTLCFEQLTQPIFLHFRRSNFQPHALQNQLYSIAQSKQGNFLDGELHARIVTSRPGLQMDGSGWSKKGAPKTKDERNASKRSIVVIANKDNTCGFRAIIVSLFHLTKIVCNTDPVIDPTAPSTSAGSSNASSNTPLSLEELTTLNRVSGMNLSTMGGINYTWENIRKHYSNLQFVSAVSLRTAAAIADDQTLSLSNIHLVEAALGGIKLIVINRETKAREYPSNIESIPDRFICIEYIPPCMEHKDGHYNALLNLTGYMEKAYFCVKCWTGAARKETSHTCSSTCCEVCLGEHDSTNSTPLSDPINCSKCNVNFSSSQCYKLHLDNKRCDTLHQCHKCQVRYKRKSKHTCLTYKCHRCNITYIETPHNCIMEDLNLAKLRKEDRKPKILIAFDIESQLVDMDHKPILLVSKRTCCHFKKNEDELRADEERASISRDVDPIVDTSIYAPCGLCNDEEKTWMIDQDGCNNVVKSFIEYVMVQARAADIVKGKVLVYAHNNRGYDGHFIMKELIEMGYPDIKPLMAQSKIMKLSIGNILFLDSLSLFQLALKKLPKAFGLTSSLKKGDFPHRFNIHENLHKTHSWPDISYYEPEKKSPVEAASIRKFVEEMQASGKLFEFDKELIEYCRIDVQILLESLVHFRDTFIRISNIDPITRCFTLASIALETYKAKFYDAKSKPIGITPKSYGEPKTHSKIGDAWIDHMEKLSGSKFFRREQRVGCKWADGAILPLKRIFEFNGCRFHGCPDCYTDRSQKLFPNSDLTVGEAYAAWLNKEQYFESLDFRVNVMWECKLNTHCRQDPGLKQYISERKKYYDTLYSDVVGGHIKPRDALFGGRTNNIKFFHQVMDNGEEIKYFDFTSLYPYEVSRKSYPVGHPVVINQNFDSTMSFTGISKCRVLPPKRIRFGVLPIKLNDRLVFPLCRSCAEEENQKTCKHTDQEREIIGTWTTPELKFAINDGYKIVEVYEELRYEREEFGMFTEYVNMWMKEKQEASGWPSWCVNGSEKDAYIRMYKEREGIELDPNKIEFNSGRRFIAKLMLNSFWGKFAQRNNMGNTEVITDPTKYFQLLQDPTKEITGNFMVKEDTMLVSWKYVDEDFSDPGNTNVVIAAYVTCYARLELLKKLKEIEGVRAGRVLYFDTDSIIFVHRAEDSKLTDTGDYLGQLTDEILKDYGLGAKCIEYVSGGPKNYACKILLPDGTEKVVIKAKGITLHEQALEKITFSEICRLVFAYIDPTNPQQQEISVEQFQIIANPKQMTVRSRYSNKRYRVVVKKRRIIGNDTVPYGYVDS